MKKMNFFSYLLMATVTLFTACTNVNDPEPEPETNALPFSETFTSDLGDFTTQNVSGEQVWAYDTHGYALMTGYVNSTNLANEDWLISPEIDLSDITAAKLSFDHVTRYFTSVTTEATVWVSENYTSGLPSTATWAQLTTPVFSNASDWTLTSSGEISLTAYAGKKIKIAFKYISTDTKAGTWELKNFLVDEGEAAVDTTNVGSGDGTEASPYDVTTAMQNQGALKWVEGYIVGNIDGQGMSITTESNFASPFTIATNMLIAASASETNYANCMPVQLPSGAIRTGLNLADNAANLGKKVKLYGSLETYFTVPGIKTVSYYELEGGSTGGTKPIDTSNAILAETFAASLGAFTQYSVAGDQTWGWSSTYKCALASGYANSTRYVNEDWLISPAFSLAAGSNAVLTFSHAGKYFNSTEATNCTLYISTDYSSGAPSTATWTQLTIPTYDTSNNFTFTSSGDISLSAYAGSSSVKIAFVYKSDGTSTGTGNWEIKDVLIQ